MSSKTTPNSASESTALMESPSSLRNAGRSSTATVCPSLPAEIWQIIFSVGEFDKHDGVFWSDYEISDLASICRSCTLFRDLVRPRLYYNFNSHILIDLNKNKWQRLSVPKFAWTISTNPRLASLVRRVDIRGVCDMWDVVSEPPFPRENYLDDPVDSVTTEKYHDDSMASVLTRRAAELGMVLRYYDVYTNVHSPQNVGFDLVAFVLAQLPMLDTLELKWCGPPPITRMPQPRGVWPWNQSIRNMTLGYLSTADPTDIRHQSRAADDCFSPVLPLFCSGTMLTGLYLWTSSGPNFALPLDNLREAIIVDCQFRQGQFLNLLKPCKGLKKFVTRCTDASLAWEIIKALEPAYSGLEILGLDFKCTNYRRYRPRISSFQQFTALKTLYLDMTCVWDMQVSVTKDSPPNPDMLLTTLLPESIEEVALFNGPLGIWTEGAYGFEFEAHARRLALERRVKGRFQNLRWLHGNSFSGIDFELEGYVEPALNDDDPDEAGEADIHVARRFSTLDETRTLMGDEGVEFTFDFYREKNSSLNIDHLIFAPEVLGT